MGNWNTKGGGLYYPYGNFFCIDMYELSPRTNCTTKTYEQGKWYTLIGTYNNQSLDLYIIYDGNIDKTTIATTGKVTTSEVPITIGVDPDSATDPITGHNQGRFTISEALIFDRALSEDEIKKDYVTEINPQNKDKLIMWYKF